SLALQLVLISLSYYGHRRDLHSFPTRRSSDLLLMQGSEVGARAPARGPACPSLALGLRLPTEAFPCVRPDGRYSWCWACCRPAADRKSTRLNSSHVKISYAVFCLKKKKKPKSL